MAVPVSSLPSGAEVLSCSVLSVTTYIDPTFGWMLWGKTVGRKTRRAEFFALPAFYALKLCIKSAKVDGPPTFPGKTIKGRPGYADSGPSRRADTPEATCPKTRALFAFNPLVKTSFDVMPPFASNHLGRWLSLVGIPDSASETI